MSHLVRGVARLAPQIEAVSAVGLWVTAADGRKYMDLTSGIGALSTGHSHPHVVNEVQKQVATLVHAQQNCVGTHPQLKRLSERIANDTRLPSPMDSVYFASTGTEAVENAVKLARRATGKPNVVSFTGGFHGRSMGGMSLSTAKVSCRRGFQPLLAGTYLASFPSSPGQVEGAKADLDSLFQRVSAPEDTAAVIVEPIQGEGGIWKVEASYMEHLRAQCDAHGILLISDEVQSGCGRAGTWWAHEEWGEAAQPDIVAFGKGIASGYPLSGTFARAALFDAMHPNSLGGTFNGSAVAACAANATLDVLEGVVPTVEAKGKRFAANLRAAGLTVRQYGLMIAIELEPGMCLQKLVASATEEHGLMVLTAGIEPTIRLLPPLTIANREIDEACERICAWLGRLPRHWLV